MANKLEISIPQLGDFKDVQVVEVLVKPGDKVVKDQPLIMLETDKATVEVPSTYEGKIIEVKVKLGDTVNAGDLVATIEGAEVDVAEVDVAVKTKIASDTANDSSEVITEPKEISIPQLGDFKDVQVVEVLVKPGDKVVKDQPLIMLETDKATVEVPSTYEGKIIEVKVKLGDTVNAGDLVVTIEAISHLSKPLNAVDQVTQKSPELNPTVVTAPTPAIGKSYSSHATPSVRRLARELGVDLSEASGTGVKGRVTERDLKAFVKGLVNNQETASALPKISLVDFSKFGPIEEVLLNRIQKISGPRLHASWVNIPHVTQFAEAELSSISDLKEKLKKSDKTIKLTPVAFIIKAIQKVLVEFPTFRSSLDTDNEKIIIKNYYNIGFAVDTPNGLMVPVIKAVDQLSISELAIEISRLGDLARKGKLVASDIEGSVFTISSLGGIGGTAFTPIINAPEVAIIGLSRSFIKPFYEKDQWTPKEVIPFSLSYDHRVIDGAEGARFVVALAHAIQSIETYS
jgi:pyruvate dehydrogenase E2 component (dihydrolipoamide acetyltransferase)